MQDNVFVVTLLLLSVCILFSPFVGVLLWTWISIMNPHKFLSGSIQDLRFNYFVAAVTILVTLVWLINNRKRMPFFDPICLALLTFCFWATVTTYFALFPSVSWQFHDRLVKIIALSVVAQCLLTNRIRMQ